MWNTVFCKNSSFPHSPQKDGFTSPILRKNLFKKSQKMFMNKNHIWKQVILYCRSSECFSVHNVLSPICMEKTDFASSNSNKHLIYESVRAREQ